MFLFIQSHPGSGNSAIRLYLLPVSELYKGIGILYFESVERFSVSPVFSFN